MYITERCVFVLKEDGLHLTEIAPGIDLQTQILDQMEFEPIIDRNADGSITLMDAKLFCRRSDGSEGNEGRQIILIIGQLRFLIHKNSAPT